MHITVGQILNCCKRAKLQWLQSSFARMQIDGVVKADLLVDYSGARVRTPAKSSDYHQDCFSRVRHVRKTSHTGTTDVCFWWATTLCYRMRE